MMNPLLLLSLLIAFVGTFILTQKWIPLAKRAGLVGKDMNKLSAPEVAEMGGIAVMGGILGGLLYYVALNTFLLNQVSYNLSIFATMSTVMIIAIVGLIDDLLGWKIGLTQWQKPLLTLPAVLPMMVINAGTSTISLPIIGEIQLGLLYPLLVVPIGIVISSNAFNMLAGYNGLEAGMGIVMLSALSFVAYYNGSAYVAMIGAVAVAALLAFLVFNWYPAKIFPGNGFTYMVGAIIACVAILGNMEKLAILLFIPYIIDFFLKARSRMKAEEFAKPNADGSLNKPYEKYYGLTHIYITVISKIKGKAYERDVTIFAILNEAAFAVIGVALFLLGLY